MKKIRLDLLLVERGLVENRSQAQRLIMAGQVRLEGQLASKPGIMVAPEAEIALTSNPRFVSRGGEKLDTALKSFKVDVNDLVCADVGASTGGFCDCLLQHGAAKVYAIDVGKGILHWKLRNDARVVVMEKTNARYVQSLHEPVGLATVDASFISLKILLPVIKKWCSSSGEGIIALIKPQFEAGRLDVTRGRGVIRDTVIHRQVLMEVLTFGQKEGLNPRGLIRSPILGPKGNVEFLAWFTLIEPGEQPEWLVEKLFQSLSNESSK